MAGLDIGGAAFLQLHILQATHSLMEICPEMGEPE